MKLWRGAGWAAGGTAAGGGTVVGAGTVLAMIVLDFGAAAGKVEFEAGAAVWSTVAALGAAAVVELSLVKACFSKCNTVN